MDALTPGPPSPTFLLLLPAVVAAWVRVPDPPNRPYTGDAAGAAGSIGNLLDWRRYRDYGSHEARIFSDVARVVPRV